MRERFYGLLEYVLAFLFIRGGLSIFLFAVAPLQVPAVLTLLTGDFAINVYGLFFALTGVALLLAKWFKRAKVRKWTLFTMFIICCYVFGLSVAIDGLSTDQWLTVVVGIVSGALYLRWKMLTEYVSKEEYEVDHERNRLHP